MTKSWKPEVVADSTGTWVGNSLRFKTREEALANVADLENRWIMVRRTRAVESDDDPNYSWDFANRRLVAVNGGPT